jgi:hypothetical protein
MNSRWRGSTTSPIKERRTCVRALLAKVGNSRRVELSITLTELEGFLVTGGTARRLLDAVFALMQRSYGNELQ